MSSNLVFITALDRSKATYTVTLEFSDKKLWNHVERFSKSIGTFFSEDGKLDELALQRELQKAISKMEESPQLKQK